MKLSLFILADWLSKYTPSVMISDGQPCLSGARLYTEGSLDLDDTLLYIGRASDVCPDEYQDETVMCVNQHDRILIASVDLQGILNEVLTAFDFYNAWEAALREAAYTSASFQTLIDLSYPVFKNPIFMVDWYGKVLGMTSQSAAKMDGTTWEYMRTQGYLPVYVYDRVQINAEQFDTIEHSQEIVRLDFPQYDYHCLHCTVFVENRPFLNFEISKNETELTEGTRQLAEILKQAVLLLLRFSNSPISRPPAISLFSDMLAGKAYHPEALYRVLQALRWESTKSWYLVALLNPFPGEMSGTALLQQLGRELPRGCYFEWESHLVMLIDCETWAATLTKFTRLLKEGSYFAGVSLPFSSWKDLPLRLKQANVALKQANRQSVVSLCSEHAWNYLVSEFAQWVNSERLLHPAIEILVNQDLEKGGSELLRTLYEYLRHERNVAETAGALYIHRNSLRYRLERINALIDADLDNPDVRLYLLLSYQLQERKLPNP